MHRRRDKQTAVTQRGLAERDENMQPQKLVTNVDDFFHTFLKENRQFVAMFVAICAETWHLKILCRQSEMQKIAELCVCILSEFQIFFYSLLPNEKMLPNAENLKTN